MLGLYFCKWGKSAQTDSFVYKTQLPIHMRSDYYTVKKKICVPQERRCGLVLCEACTWEHKSVLILLSLCGLNN